jgi:transcriptional regulator with XRE-family HTH domain
MPLGERIKALRTERGWSQDELADKVGSDARGISRYENNKITPSLEALVRIAQALDVSLDHLAVEDIPRRPLRVPADVLGDRLGAIAELDDSDRDALLSVIDAFVTKNRIKAVISPDTA